jgi:hypothetical protein
VSKFLKDKSIAAKMLEESLSYFEYLPLKMRNDKNFITPYITKSPGLIRFLGKQVFNDVEFVNSFSNTDMISKFSIYSYLAKSNLLNNIYRYYDHISFNIIKEIIKPYFLEKNSLFLNNLYEEKSQFKLREILTHNPIDPTAQWDPLELPSDDEYYHLKPGFSWKKVKVKIHNLLNFRW